jgi:hypothetical protein
MTGQFSQTKASFYTASAALTRSRFGRSSRADRPMLARFLTLTRIAI